MIRSTLLALTLAATAVCSQAAAVVPEYTTFGNLAGATFNGTNVSSGIPTNPTAITTDAAHGITIGLTAFGRYANPALTNNGAGTFYATPGANDGLDGGGHTVGSTWGFGYYINVGTAKFSNYRVELFYDLNPAAGTPLADLGRIDFNTAGGGGLSLFQDSYNLTFAFLNTGATGVTPGTGGPFNPNAPGEYGFVLRVSDLAGAVLAESAILVNVPEPGSVALVGVALLAAFGLRRRAA